MDENKDIRKIQDEYRKFKKYIDIATAFYNGYLKNDYTFNTNLSSLIKSKDWKAFIEEIETICDLYECSYAGDASISLQEDDGLSYKHDFIDYLASLKQIESPTKYKVKIQNFINKVENLKRPYKLNCEDILKCNTNFRIDSPEINFFRKDFIKNDNWKAEMELMLKDKIGVELFDHKLLKRIIGLYHNIRISFINIMVFCVKKYSAEPELFNCNVEILVNINRLNDLLAEFINSSFSMNRKELNNTKSLILAVSDNFYKNLKREYAIDFSESYYHQKIQNFIKDIEDMAISKLIETTEYDRLPDTLKAEQIYSLKEKQILHLLMIDHNSTRVGVQKIYKFLKDFRSNYNIAFKMTLKEVYEFSNYHYKTKHKVDSKQYDHNYEDIKFKIKNTLDEKLDSFKS